MSQIVGNAMAKRGTGSIPLGRVGSAMECAKVIVFTASDAASYIGGESIEVRKDGLVLFPASDLHAYHFDAACRKGARL
jgi:NAD(P)-dependent dehydrogenase (short-subunit alcohol dehydrogenase family)